MYNFVFYCRYEFYLFSQLAFVYVSSTDNEKMSVVSVIGYKVLHAKTKLDYFKIEQVFRL